MERGALTSRADTYYNHVMFSAAIHDGDYFEKGDEFNSENTDSIASFAEWFFSGDEHLEQNNHRSSGRRCGCDEGNGAAIPTEMRNWCSANETDGNDNEILTKRCTKKSVEAPQYNEFIQCAKSSIDIVSYVLDPLGDICRGKKFGINTSWDERKYQFADHPDQKKLNRYPEKSYFTKQQRLECSEMNYFSKDPSLEIINECNTTSTATSSNSCSIDAPTASFSPRGVEMTSHRTVEQRMDIPYEFDDVRLGIAPLIQFSNFNNDIDNTGLVRQLFVSDEDELFVSFGTNVYRENGNEQYQSTTLSQMLIETVHLHSHFQFLDAPNDEVRPLQSPSPSPDPHAIYCSQPRQRIRLEENKYRTTPLLVDPHAVYCCTPRVRIRHEKTCNENKGNSKNSASNRNKKQLLVEQLITKSSESTTVNVSTLPASPIIASSTKIHATRPRWSGDRLQKAKMKRRAKMNDRLNSTS